ncbi:MAG TPA: tetratricopeptide repeat protein [Candidatus Competibacter sp.]|nr:tetratricopeptide repeat protein [Candidatus Competibacter sp.]
MARKNGCIAALILCGMLLGGAGCGGPASTPLQAQYRREEERALRYHAKGELPQALQAFRDSLRWAELADDRPAIMVQSLQIGTVALALGEWSVAEQSFWRAERMAAEIKASEGVLQARLGFARASLMRGRLDVAREAFAKALVEGRERGDEVAALVALNGLGLAQKGLGQPEEAGQLLSEAETLARARGDKRLLAATLANRGDLALRIDGPGRAEPYLAEAIQLDRETENLPGLTHDLILLAQVREQRNDLSSALELYRRALAIAQHTGQHDPARQCRRAIERLEHESGVPLQQGQVKSIQ